MLKRYNLLVNGMPSHRPTFIPRWCRVVTIIEDISGDEVCVKQPVLMIVFNREISQRISRDLAVLRWIQASVVFAIEVDMTMKNEAIENRTGIIRHRYIDEFRGSRDSARPYKRRQSANWCMACPSN
jgi:hypothetical protein